MCGSHCEAWRRSCGGALLVTLSVIYLEFKAQLIIMATTAFCCDTPTHLVCTEATVFTRQGCVRAIWPRKRVMVLHLMTWPPQSPDLNPIEMVWDELDCKVKWKQPTSAQHMWELLQEFLKSFPGEAGWEHAKSVQSCHQGKEWLLWRISTNTFLVTTWFHVLFHSFKVFTIFTM